MIFLAHHQAHQFQLIVFHIKLASVMNKSHIESFQVESGIPKLFHYINNVMKVLLLTSLSVVRRDNI